MNAKTYSVDWEKTSEQTYSQFPETFVFAFWNRRTKTLAYLGAAYLKAMRVQIPKYLGLQNLHLADIDVWTGYVENADGEAPNERELCCLVKLLKDKYKPTHVASLLSTTPDLEITVKLREEVDLMTLLENTPFSSVA